MNRNMLAGILASAALALVFAFVFAALTVYGIIDMGLARILLACAWVVGVTGTAVSDLVWEKGNHYKVTAPMLVACLLAFTLWRLDTFVQNKKMEQAKAEKQAQSTVPAPLIQPAPQNSTREKSRRSSSVAVIPHPSPTPLTADEVADRVAKKLLEQRPILPPAPVPTTTPLPKPPCRGDKLNECTDEDLLEWGKPLVAEMERYYGYYRNDMDAAQTVGDVRKRLAADDKAEELLADRFRDCCAEETDRYYKEIEIRVGGGHQQNEFSEWEKQLLMPIGSKEWKTARSRASLMIMNVHLQLQLRMIDLDTSIKMANLRKSRH